MKCPICSQSFKNKSQVEIVTSDVDPLIVTSILCPGCHAIRFFDDDVQEVKYRQRKAELIKFFQDRYPQDYNPIVHDTIIDGLVRTELQVKHYESVIANNREKGSTIYSLLSNERQHWRSLFDKLNISIQAMRKDKGKDKPISKEFADVMKEILSTAEIDVEDIMAEVKP